MFSSEAVVPTYQAAYGYDSGYHNIYSNNRKNIDLYPLAIFLDLRQSNNTTYQPY